MPSARPAPGDLPTLQAPRCLSVLQSRSAGLPATLRFHDLRHTHAALLIADGWHPLAISRRLGHSTMTVTMDRYGHLLPSLEAELLARSAETFTRSLTQTDFDAIAEELNNRPRQTLGFKTPSESLAEALR